MLGNVVRSMYRFFFQYTRLQQLLQLLKHDRFTPFGFVFSRIFPDRQSLLEAALDLAEMIASKSPVAVQGTKHNIVYARDHSVPESLHYMVSVCVCASCGFVGVVWFCGWPYMYTCGLWLCTMCVSSGCAYCFTL